MPVIDVPGTYADQLRVLEDGAGAGPAWLRRLRREAFARFEALGFPTTRQEEWRFTNVAPIANGSFDPPPDTEVPVETLAPFRFAGHGWAELVFVNGRPVPRLAGLGALPRGVVVESLADAVARDGAWIERQLGRHARYEQHAFRALNTAFVHDGVVLQIPAGAELPEPIHLFFFAAPGTHAAVTHPRVLVVAGANSRARIVESYAGTAGARYFTNAVSEIVVGAGAAVDHYRLQRESLRAFHVSTTQVRLAAASRFVSHAVTLGGGLVRNEVNAVFDGEGADCTLNGVYLANGDRLVDNHTAIDHARPLCASHEVYKGILDGRAKAVFNGKILVRQDAQKTDAKQTNKVLLLSDEAQVNTKPQLEIFADDVKCTHGATVGQIDDEALFYLRSRGLGREAARNLLIYAFASEIVARIDLEPVRRQLDAVLLAELPR